MRYIFILYLYGVIKPDGGISRLPSCLFSLLFFLSLVLGGVNGVLSLTCTPWHSRFVCTRMTYWHTSKRLASRDMLYYISSGATTALARLTPKTSLRLRELAHRNGGQNERGRRALLRCSLSSPVVLVICCPHYYNRWYV